MTVKQAYDFEDGRGMRSPILAMARAVGMAVAAGAAMMGGVAPAGAAVL